MVETVTRKPCILNDLNSLQLDLMDKLKDTKFLIVLDDLWIEDDVNWSRLKEPFQHGIRGSKILVTTRNENVVSVVCTVQAYHLNQLSNEDCRLVFANHACLSSESSENITTLEKIGRQIVKKCNGLPLAAQLLGGLDALPDSIEDMPRGMGKLNHLQHLDFFIVGKHEENGIKELGGLSNLHGLLSIRNLENVIKSEEALEARIMDKKHIDSLSLQWSGCYNCLSN
ncbi:putative disease resistance RPP13 protein 1 [Spatholobus suberectus]|nr:putative disease resistance RPP13 protein 1 [Spatholobus suberectus]